MTRLEATELVAGFTAYSLAHQMSVALEILHLAVLIVYVCAHAYFQYCLYLLEPRAAHITTLPKHRLLNSDRVAWARGISFQRLPGY